MKKQENLLGTVTKQISKEIQFQKPNFVENGELYLMRCYKCDPENGRENWAPYVATGQCAWCGWKEEVKDDENS